MERKVIQITSAPDESIEIIYALCDDGSMWRLITLFKQGRGDEEVWRRVPDIPQA